MKKILLFVVIVSMFLSGCKKDTHKDAAEQQSLIETLQVASDFNWKLSRDVEFSIELPGGSIIRITSLGGDVVYHKGLHKAEEPVYRITVSIPSSVTEVMVNNKQVSLYGKTVDVNLFDTKSVLATNKSVQFTGTGFCEIQDISALNNASAFTFEAWVKQANTSAFARLFHKYAGAAQDISIATYMSKLYFEVGNGANSYGFWSDYATTISNNTWYHLAAVYDGTQVNPNDRIKLYINGSLISLTYNGTIPATTYNFPPGWYQFLSWDQKLTGFMDEVRIWNYARTGTEINNDMNKTLAGTETGFLAYYKFDALNFGFKCPDASGHHSDAMLFAGFSLSTDVPFSYVVDTDGDGVADTSDDYPTDATRAFDNFFPAAGYGSLAFEDLWPGKGDYDFNDIVVDYRFKTVTNASNSVVEIFGAFPIKASGAYLHNGFGFNLPDASSAFTGNPQKLNVSGYDIREAYVTLNAFGHEEGQTKPTIIVFDDVFNILPHPGLGLGVNTEEWVTAVDYDTLVITMEPNGVFSQANFSLTTWNPFIMVDQTRGLEIHLPDYPPTDLVDISYFGTWEDDSEPASDRYYKTVLNLPWALDIPSAFKWPLEKKEITRAYLHFAEWAETSGAVYTDWYEDKPGYREDSFIYSP